MSPLCCNHFKKGGALKKLVGLFFLLWLVVTLAFAAIMLLINAGGGVQCLAAPLWNKSAKPEGCP